MPPLHVLQLMCSKTSDYAIENAHPRYIQYFSVWYRVFRLHANLNAISSCCARSITPASEMYFGPYQSITSVGKGVLHRHDPQPKPSCRRPVKLHAELIIFGNRGSVSIKCWLVGHNHNNHRVLDSVSAENVGPDRVYDGIAASLEGPSTR